jgi:cytoskeletal protein CcmA (bactofilin family)
VSFKEDFIEALRSVKRDFFRDNEDKTEQQQVAEGAKETSQSASPSNSTPLNLGNVVSSNNAPSELDEDIMEAFRKASALEDNSEEEASEQPNATPYRNYEKNSAPTLSDAQNDAMNNHNVYDNQGPERPYVDFTNTLYDDEKTVISRNTVIRGSVETDDSIRLLGQVLGDIDCKANIVVAGKVRGNTTAANAYIYDAQVDGNIHCQDAITISNDAWILGNLKAQQAEIDGKIKGNIEIRHAVSIGSTSSILGNISTDELEIKRGAFVNGQIMMYSPSRDVLERFNRFDE